MSSRIPIKDVVPGDTIDSSDGTALYVILTINPIPPDYYIATVEYPAMSSGYKYWMNTAMVWVDR